MHLFHNLNSAAGWSGLKVIKICDCDKYLSENVYGTFKTKKGFIL